MRISDWSSDVCSSDLLTYFTHYTDSYSNPTNPYLDAVGHQIGLYSDGSFARLNVFSTDNNLQFKFSTGPAIEHTVLFGLDYSWNNVRKRGGLGRSEEHTSEHQSLMRTSYAVFILKKKTPNHTKQNT